jgi:4-carboxymuconolactone decarboxylase
MAFISDESFKKGMDLLIAMGREETMIDHKALSEDLYRYDVGFLFGEVWQRPHLSLRDRQLITLAANVALARPTGSHSHYRSAKKIGVTHEQIMEVIMHVGMYAGWPCMSHAIKQYLEVLEGDAKAAPWRDKDKDADESKTDPGE